MAYISWHKDALFCSYQTPVRKPAQEISMTTQPGVDPERIDINNPAAVEQWAKKLDATKEQLREAVQAVGDKAADVEMHLKGSRSSTNSDRVQELGGI
jgi:hypothetical protein